MYQLSTSYKICIHLVRLSVLLVYRRKFSCDFSDSLNPLQFTRFIMEIVLFGIEVYLLFRRKLRIS